MKDVELLQRLGISSLESHIYYTLLAQPTMTLSEIVRASKLQRTSVHRALPSLVSRKLVDEVQVGRRTHYRAVSPTKLTTIVDELVHDAQHLIPPTILDCWSTFFSATVITIEHETFAAFQKYLFLLMFHSLPKT